MSRDIRELVWFKSSYSGGEGGQCVEVAMDWRKSSYSGAQGGECVEVASCRPDTVHVRDSKNSTGPVLTFAAHEWAEFVGFTASANTNV
ncbi:DUF397 domain-containing protein [Streptomyces hygroscopicus subsp. hygroscopicus]|uniref:DUF397 domain-containing protein n=1 Tax=Streptomyces TaxID=1883 RepID=UPI001C655AC9|nr:MULTISPECIES: DUF397 domain-containing protein [Streptomyces]MBW8088986.1 DUF397 domain-containing protein [Streptomyces hygroscopicus subsp. hygroscopicus]MCO8301530.1 DUF397 domain-containing protein [Streptomyces sp. RKCA744]